MEIKDFYYILGVSRTASKEEIKQAYRKLSIKFHPGQNNGEKYWEEKFTEITEAYETLIDGEERRKYDERLSGKSGESSNNNSQSENDAFSKSETVTNSDVIQKKLSTKKKRTITWTGVIIVLVIVSQIYKAVSINEKRKERDKILDAYVQSVKNPVDSTTPTATLLPPQALIKDSTVTSGEDSSVNVVPSDLSEIYKVEWTTGEVSYKGALLLNKDKSGFMRLKFFANGHSNFIEEFIDFKHTEKGDCFAGSNPTIISETNIRYAPDNLYISKDVNENFVITNQDDRGSSDVCTVTELTGFSEKNDYLAGFNWRIIDDVR